MTVFGQRTLVAGLALTLLAGGCSTTNAGTEGGTAAAAEQSGTQGGEQKAASEAGDAQAESSTADAAESASAGELVPEGMEPPQACPEIVNLTLPDEEKSPQELHDWFCERFDATGTPSYEDVDSEMFASACTLETVGTQGASRNEQGEVRCFDAEGRTIGMLMLRGESVSLVRTHEFDGGDEPVRSVSGNSERCSVTTRSGDTAVTFSSSDGDGLTANERVDYDDQNRVIRRVEKQSNGETVATEIKYESTDGKTSKTTIRNGQKATETVEFLRSDGTVERKVERTFSDGELLSATQTTFDEQGRPIRIAPPEGVQQSFASIETRQYEGDSENPVRRKIVSVAGGEEQGSITISYELDDQGRHVSSTVDYGSGQTVQESWSYEDGRLVEKHVAEQLIPGRGAAPLMHVEIRYDDSGRPVFHQRWRGEKDNSRDSKWTTTMTYGCMK